MYRPGRAPWFVWVLTAALMLLVATWASITPSLRAPDETAHFSSSYRLSEGFAWPDPGDARMPNAITATGSEVNAPHETRSSLRELAEANPGVAEDRGDQMTQHPFLYYLFTGAVLDVPGVKDLPWGQALFLLRLTGALFVAPLVWLAWNGITTLTRSRRIGAVAAITPFVVPQLAQNFGTLTNDSPAILMAWVVSWIGIKVWCGDRRPAVLAALGAAMGVAALTKGTALPIGLFVVLVLLFGRGRTTARRTALEVIVPLLLTAFIGGWWWLRNLVLFRSLQPDGMGPFLTIPEWAPGESPDVFYYISEIWRVTVRTFWGWFARVLVPLPEPLVETLTVLCLTLLAVGLFRVRRNRATALVLLVPVIAMVALFIRTSWTSYVETTSPHGLHGRYFFTLLLLVIAMEAIAARSVIREEAPRRVFAVLVIVGAGAFSVFGLAVAVAGLYGNYTPFSLPSAIPAWLAASPLTSVWDAVLLVLLAATLTAGVVGALRGALSRVSPLATGAPADPAAEQDLVAGNTR